MVENIIKSVPKSNEPQPKPVVAGPKTTYAYIGNVNPTNNSADILFNIYIYSGVEIKPSDIQEIDNRGPNKSFKIAVPQDKLEIITSKLIWNENIKAEPFGKPKSKGPAFSQRSHNYSSNRSYDRSQTFRDPSRNAQNWQRHQPSRQWSKPTKPVKAGPQAKQYPPNGYYRPAYKY
ncbi:unnamed protein product [Meganyctiphanes norvegica]|uniref:Uncharacterized protein n=1 Tax=Meganyctiphanes norvegica TaxID=48144 RepID=A0AAV2RTZ6_MEGNR